MNLGTWESVSDRGHVTSETLNLSHPKAHNDVAATKRVRKSLTNPQSPNVKLRMNSVQYFAD